MTLLKITIFEKTLAYAVVTTFLNDQFKFKFAKEFKFIKATYNAFLKHDTVHYGFKEDICKSLRNKEKFLGIDFRLWITYKLRKQNNFANLKS
jgi:hypothetical protein